MLALMLCLAACKREASQPPAVLAPLERDNGRIEWAGMQPCADCDGIDTRLELVRDQGDRSFVLTETYLAQRPVQFVTRGRWSRQAQLLQLQSDQGVRVGYAVLEDGRLQPRDLRGRRLPDNDGDGLLVPQTSITKR